MYTYYDPYTTLYHFGIKGQKWGIRRYQNYDGTYTQKGLARYNRSQEEYEKAKRQMKADRKSLKRDYMIDEGKKLSDKGETIKSEAKTIGRNMALALAGHVIARGIEDARPFGEDYDGAGGNSRLNDYVSDAIRLGSWAVSAALQYKSVKNLRNLKAYQDKDKNKNN